MARTITEIFASIEAAKNAEPVLSEQLTSTSLTAVWRLWAYVIATVLWAHETLWDLFRAEVDAIVARATPGTPGWYAGRALEFQQGDTVEVIDNVIRYPAGSTGARIVTRATAKESIEGTLFIKVAKDGAEPGALQALEASEKTQFIGYIRTIRFAGTRIEVVSREADRIKLAGEVFFNPLIAEADMKAAVSAAVSAYLAAIPFDGVIYRSKIMDAIQAVPGVADVVLEEITARSGLVEYPVDRIYETQAGYMVEDDAAGASFSQTLTFVPND